MDEGRARVPSPLSPLLGREREVAALCRMVGEHRLVTVVGPGGCGKTRLALEVAAQIPVAVFVDLSVLSNPELVLPAVARALGLHEAGAQSLVTTLVHHLRDRDGFVVLDNVEHLLAAVDGVGEVLATCPRLRVLATSRCPLRLPGERLMPLRPLPVPAPDARLDPDDLTAHPSMQLFVDRARATEPDLSFSASGTEVVAAICRALDGLPLAVELAAAQVRVLGVDEVRARTEYALSSGAPPRRGVPQRHRSLDNALGWSVALLGEEAATLFRRLSVFAGSWTSSTAQRVCGEPNRDVRPALAMLVEHSLVEPVHRGPVVRYRMLETLRRYSAGMPRGPGDDAVSARHAQWCRAIAAAVASCAGPEETARLDVAEAELDDLRLALDSCPASATSLGLRTAADLYHFWDIRGYLGEGRRQLERLLARPEAEADPHARQGALQALGLLLLWQDELDAARATLIEASDLAEHNDDPGGWAWCAGNLGIAHFAGGDVEAVVPRVERGLAVARETGQWMPLLRATCGLGLVRWAQGRHAEARALLEENAALVAASAWGVAKADYFLGWFSFLDGDLAEADRRFRSGVTSFARIGDRRSLPDCYDGAACVAGARGAAAEALELLTIADGLRERAGSRRNAYLRSHCNAARTIARAATEEAPPAGLTPREYEVARLVAEGLTNRQIGRRLGISERTAERHTENLRAKLGVRTRTQIAAWVAALPRHGSAVVAVVPDTTQRAEPVD